MLQESGDEEEKEEGDGVFGDAKREMELYLQDKSKAKSGPLVWWKSNCSRFPKLTRAAKQCLCIPATSTPSERIFPTAGYIINKRSSLLPENVNTLVCLSHNMKKV